MQRIARKSVVFAALGAVLVILTSLQLHYNPIHVPWLAPYVLWMRLVTIAGMSVSFVLSIRQAWQASHLSHEMTRVEVLGEILSEFPENPQEFLHTERHQKT